MLGLLVPGVGMGGSPAESGAAPRDSDTLTLSRTSAATLTASRTSDDTLTLSRTSQTTVDLS